ncbi:unnamed protein product [Paramecium octaurelia]|uniref:Uncharacterized protein n=1 Tax=Paramecium octaurelia TaxID=43137 RepID=A0A8S1XA89_PAROT|nr:unnamed protein product [Paramecium octaurelia]
MKTNYGNPSENSYESQIIQPTLMPSHLFTNTQIQKQPLVQVPLVPLRQGHKSQTTIEPPQSKSKVQDSTQLNRDASTLIAKLDSLREIQTQESLPRHHQSTYVQSKSKVLLEFKNTTPKTVQLQQNVFASYVEPFRQSKSISNPSASQNEGWIETLPPQKNYEALIETLMKEQDSVVKQYCERISTLDKKVTRLSQENTNLIEQNKLLLDQNFELNEEISQWKNYLNQSLEYQKANSQSQNDNHIIEQQFDYNNSLLKQENIKKLQQQINSILEQKNTEINGYISQISDQTQLIQELNQQINQYLRNESSLQTMLGDLQNKIKSQEKQIEKSTANNYQANVQDQYEYKQLVLQLESKCGTITEKETQIYELKNKNSRLQQQLLQFSAYQQNNRDYENSLEQKQKEIIKLQQELQRKNQEFITFQQQLSVQLKIKNEESEKIINNLEQALLNNNEELQKVTLELKTVKKEKAKLSMNLMTAGMANLVMTSQGSIQGEIYT